MAEPASRTSWERFPDGSLKTRLGELVFDHGYPAADTVKLLYDEIDFQRACQIYLWALPIVSLAQIQHAYATVFAVGDCDLMRHTDYRSKLGMLTANATTPYLGGFPNMARTGPLVIEVPAGEVAGLVDDFWQRPVTDLGLAGPDKGKGGKYLFVGPGVEPPVQDGYIVIRSPTNNIMQGIRVLTTDPKEGEALLGQLRVYPYAQRANPPAMKVHDAAGKAWYGMPARGLEYFERLHAILQEEPTEERDRLFMAMLRPLGIVKGKPFKPDERQARILTEAALVGEAMAKANDFEKRIEGVRVWEGRRWDNALCLDPSQRAQGYDQLDERASWFYEAFGTSAAMVTTTPGVGQVYLAASKDNNGDRLKGEKNYSLRVPPKVPVAQFWSFTVYDNDTRALIDNGTQKADLSSRQDLAVNADGSVDLYFGPQAPPGKEANWVETLPSKGWFTYFRLYAPTEPYFSKTWKLPDIAPAASA